jgi:hypothetical protein
MSLSSAAITGDQLTDALRALHVNFILGGNAHNSSLHKQPARLISSLAESNEARLRLALIPLFLQHPEFADYALDAAKLMDAPARLTLQCYYTAAMLLAQVHHLPFSLPDHFSKDIHLSLTADPLANLQALANRHSDLVGQAVNWMGTYQHAEEIWQKGLERPAHGQIVQSLSH